MIFGAIIISLIVIIVALVVLNNQANKIAQANSKPKRRKK